MARWSFILSACWLGLMLAPTSGIQMSGFIDVYVVASAYSQDVSIAVNTYHVQLAKFGPRLTKDGLRSMLVRADPPDGCSALAPPPSEKFTFTEKWTVLIDRGNCTFETKIRNAQAAGFDCAIVHDLDDSELAELETMTAKDIVGIDIPSVFATGSTGFQLGGLFTYSNGYYVVVRAPPDAPLDPKEAMNTRLLLLAVGALCVFWIVLVKYICNRRARALPSWRPLHAPPLEKAGNYKTPTFLTTFTGPPKTKSKEEEAKQHFSATAP